MPDNVEVSAAPTNKAVAATAGSAFGGAIAVLAIAGIKQVMGELPTEQVQAAITTVVTTLVTLAAAYYTPPGAHEAVIATAEGLKTGRVVPPPQQQV